MRETDVTRSVLEGRRMAEYRRTVRKATSLVLKMEEAEQGPRRWPGPTYW